MRQGRPKKRLPGVTVSDADLTLKELGIDKRISWQAQRLAAIPEADFKALLALRVHGKPLSITGILRLAGHVLSAGACGSMATMGKGQ